MAGPLSGLRLGARLLEPIIRGAVWLGRTGLETTRDILAAGVRGLDAEIAAIHRAEATIKGATAAITVAEQEIPDILGIPESVTAMRREFSYTVKITTIDPTTGKPIERYINVSTDKAISPSEAKRQAEALAEDEYVWFRQRNMIKSEVTAITRAAPGKRL